jgi:hypothetical protein
LHKSQQKLGPDIISFTQIIIFAQKKKYGFTIRRRALRRKTERSSRSDIAHILSSSRLESAFKLDLPTYMGIHPAFNIDHLKLYNLSILNGDEDEYVMFSPKELDADWHTTRNRYIPRVQGTCNQTRNPKIV